MLDLQTIKSRLITIVKIGCGNHDKLTDLDISERGFKASFQAFISAIPGLVVDIIYNIKFSTLSHSFFEIVFNNIIVSIIAWYMPLGVIVLALYLMQLKNKAAPFTIAYNWFQAFFNLIYIPITLIPIFFTITNSSFGILALAWFIPLVFMMYQVFAAVFHEKFIFNFGILFLNIILQIFITNISINFFKLI